MGARLLAEPGFWLTRPGQPVYLGRPRRATIPVESLRILVGSSQRRPKDHGLNGTPSLGATSRHARKTLTSILKGPYPGSTTTKKRGRSLHYSIERCSRRIGAAGSRPRPGEATQVRCIRNRHGRVFRLGQGSAVRHFRSLPHRSRCSGVRIPSCLRLWPSSGRALALRWLTT